MEDRALTGDFDRSLKFGHGGGLWAVNGRGWDHNDNLGKGKHIEFDVSPLCTCPTSTGTCSAQ